MSRLRQLDPLRGLALIGIVLPTGALAYASFLWPLLGRPSRVVDALASAGRLCLTHYLTQSVVLAALFYGLGLGLWGRLGSAGAVVVAMALVSLQIAMSGRILKCCGTGPAERLLRHRDRAPGQHGLRR